MADSKEERIISEVKSPSGTKYEVSWNEGTGEVSIMKTRNWLGNPVWHDCKRTARTAILAVQIAEVEVAKW